MYRKDVAHTNQCCAGVRIILRTCSTRGTVMARTLSSSRQLNASNRIYFWSASSSGLIGYVLAILTADSILRQLPALVLAFRSRLNLEPRCLSPLKVSQKAQSIAQELVLETKERFGLRNTKNISLK